MCDLCFHSFPPVGPQYEILAIIVKAALEYIRDDTEHFHCQHRTHLGVIR